MGIRSQGVFRLIDEEEIEATMPHAPIALSDNDFSDSHALAKELSAKILGEVRFDNGSRCVPATWSRVRKKIRPAGGRGCFSKCCKARPSPKAGRANT